jgi:curli biogenesis system outer membrane secretion channel CsgG
MRIIFYFLVFILFLSFKSTSQVTTVTVVSEGSGISVEQATIRALKSAVRSRNKTSIDVLSNSTIGKNSSSNDDSIYTQSNTENTNISYKGFIKSYNVINKKFSKIDNEYTVKLQVDVYQLENQLDSFKKTIAVMPLKYTNSAKSQPNNILNEIHSEIESVFVQSKKFNVLSRSDLQIVSKEWELMSSDMVADIEKIKLNNLNVADYLVVISFNKLQVEKTSKKESITGQHIQTDDLNVSVDFKIINTISGKIAFSTSEQFLVENNQEKLNEILKNISLKSIFQIFPPMITQKLNSENFVVNYGSETIKAGSTYNIYLLTDDIVDPYTGEKIGYSEKLAGTGIIKDVKEKYSIIQVTNSALPIGKDMIIRKVKQPLKKNVKKKNKGVSLSF